MDRIQFRRDTLANWNRVNPILLEGEIGYVSDDPNLYKMGDGVKTWDQLPFRGFDGTIVHETGSNKNAVMSQNATSEKFTEIEQGIIYDVSAHNNRAVFESLSDLLSNSNLSTLIPTSVRHGGMSIRFIQGSTTNSDNKYVQYRLMGQSFTTDVTQWQGVDDEPTANSDNLVKSGGVYNKEKEIREELYTYSSVEDVTANNGYITANGDINTLSLYRYKVYPIGDIKRYKITSYGQADAPFVKIYAFYNNANPSASSLVLIGPNTPTQITDYYVDTPKGATHLAVSYLAISTPIVVQQVVNKADKYNIELSEELIKRVELGNVVEDTINIRELKNPTTHEIIYPLTDIHGLVNNGNNGVDTNPTVGSKNLVTSGGVEEIKEDKIFNSLEVTGISSNTFISNKFVKGTKYRITILDGALGGNVSLAKDANNLYLQKLTFIDGVSYFTCNVNDANYIFNSPATNVKLKIEENISLKKIYDTVVNNNENLAEINSKLEYIKKSTKTITCTSSNAYTSCVLTKGKHYTLKVQDGSIGSAVWLSVNSENTYKQKLIFVDGVADFICEYDNIAYIFNSPAANVTFELTEYENINDSIDTLVTRSKSNSNSINSINQQLNYIVASKENVTGTNNDSYIRCPLVKNIHYKLIITSGSVGSNVWLSVDSSNVFKQKLNFVDGISDFICNFDNIKYIHNAPATDVTFELTTFESLPELSETVNRLNGDNTNFNNIVYDKRLSDKKKSYKGNDTNQYISLSDIGYKKGNVYFIANFTDNGYRIAQSDTDGGQFFYVSPTYIDETTHFGYYNIEKDYIVLTTAFFPAYNITFIHPIEERINYVDSKLGSTKQELIQYTRNYVKVYSHNAICSFIDDDMGSNVATVWRTILNATGIRVGFACVTDKVGTEPYATLSDVQTLYNGGNEIYSHSFDHNYAFYDDNATPEIIEEECWKSKTWLLNNGFIRNADTIVYPGGININPAKEEVIRRHFRYGVNSTAGEAGNADPVNRYCISRVNADTATLEDLKRYVDNAIINKRLLVFMTHSTIINTDEQIEKIKTLIKYIQENNTLILPLREALNQIYGYDA